MYRDGKGLCWNTGLGSEKSTLPSACTERAFPPGERSPHCPQPPSSVPWLPWPQSGSSRLQRGLGPRLSACHSASSHGHRNAPLLLTLPLLFPSCYAASTISVFVLADSFQCTPQTEFIPSGPNSITFCQNLVLKITAAENYQSAQSWRKTRLSSQEINLSFSF